MKGAAGGNGIVGDEIIFWWGQWRNAMIRRPSDEAGVLNLLWGPGCPFFWMRFTIWGA